MNFSHNPLRPDLLLILVTMFALIAVIVKPETRVALPLTCLEKFRVHQVQNQEPGQA